MIKVQNDVVVITKSVDRLSIPMRISIFIGWWCLLYAFYIIYGLLSFGRAFPSYRFVAPTTHLKQSINIIYLMAISHWSKRNEMQMRVDRADNKPENDWFQLQMKWFLFESITFEIQLNRIFDGSVGVGRVERKNLKCINVSYSVYIYFILNFLRIIEFCSNICLHQYWITSNKMNYWHEKQGMTFINRKTAINKKKMPDTFSHFSWMTLDIYKVAHTAAYMSASHRA